MFPCILGGISFRAPVHRILGHDECVRSAGRLYEDKRNSDHNYCQETIQQYRYVSYVSVLFRFVNFVIHEKSLKNYTFFSIIISMRFFDSIESWMFANDKDWFINGTILKEDRLC